jgi:AAHS family 4-hydroxybenzoate transporter-like MFS transporter
MTATETPIEAPTRLSRRTLWVVALCAAVVLMDGVDAQVMGYVAPTLRHSWSLDPSALGAVFSAGLFGMMAGSMLFGIVGDKLGRKNTIVLCVILLGLLTALTATAGSVEALFAWRFAAGVALGGVGPNAYALTAEHSPPKRRALMIMIVATAFPFGGGLGGIAAAPLVVSVGWQAVFIVSGIATLVAIPFLLWKLPKSVPAEAEVGAVPAKGFPLLLLFAEGRALLTLLIWVLYFSTMLGMYFLSNWLPTLAHEAGVPLAHSVRMMSSLQFGGVIGSLVVALFLSRFGAAKVLAVTYVVAAAAVVLIGRSGSAELLMGSAAFVAGACLNGALIAVISMASEFYPGSMRSTGIGWGSALGRIGAATGPLMGGALLSAGWMRPDVFSAVAAPILLSAVTAILFSVLVKRVFVGRAAALPSLSGE